MEKLKKVVKFLVVGALVVMCAGGSILIGIGRYPDDDLTVVQSGTMEKIWVRLGQLLFIVVFALLVAAVKVWLDNRGTSSDQENL